MSRKWISSRKERKKSVSDTEKTLPLRSAAAKETCWSVENVYADTALWEQDLALIRPLLEKAALYDGHLAEGWELFRDCLLWQEELGRKLEKLYVYAAMKRDEDNGNSLYQGLYQRIESLYVEASAKLAFFAPQVLALPEETMDAYLREPALQLYTRMIQDIRREKPHMRNEAEEKLLAASGEIASSFDNIYSMLCDADMTFPVIENEQGEKEQLSHGNYVRFLRSRDRRVRKDAFDGLYATYRALGNTLAANYVASVKKDNFYAAAHHYDSALAASLFGDNVPEEVYRNLITTVRKHQGAVADYLRLRKSLLGVDQLHLYDVYVPLFPELKQEFHWEKAKEIVLDALAPLGEQYVRDFRAGLDARWVDVYENKGKCSGAYSGGAYDTAPYILMNFQNDLNSVFTLAHEGGHSMHSYYTRKNQPYVYGDYRIFVAEVASTVNENLLIHHLLNKAESKEESQYLLNHYLEEFRTTVFRQTMFAEFELKAHEMAQNGEALTFDSLSEMYYALNRDYFGPDVVLDEAIAWEWARIPHFYRAYYVYKYATGFTAASALAMGLLDPDPAKAEKNRQAYLRFLSAGSTKDPIDLLADAGVDMRSPEAVEKALSLFGDMVKQLGEKA